MVSKRLPTIAVLLGALVLVGLQFFAVYTEAVNWDEFALGWRAERTLSTGILHTGGRPGLTTLLMLPFAKDCVDSVTAIRQIRLVWVLFTILQVAGLLCLLRYLCQRQTSPWVAPLVATGLFIFAPLFVRWSVQVRTDQIAMAGALWAGVVLLLSRKRPRLALLAGVLLGLGYLSSQKAIYAGALIGLLTLSDHFVDAEWQWRRELQRILLFAIGSIVIVVGYKALIALAFELQHRPIGLHFDIRNYYRERHGFTLYKNMAPTLIPHGVMAVLLVCATIRGAIVKAIDRQIWVAWAVFGLCGAIVWFHASAFAYFWITIGLFPSIAFAVAWNPMLELFTNRRIRWFVMVVIVAASVFPALRALADRMTDTQAIQRDSLSFVNNNFSPDDRGFHFEGGLFCRRDPAPFRARSGIHITKDFYGDNSRDKTRRFLIEFRDRPVKFIVASQRMWQLPHIASRFWRDNYVHYREAVLIPGHSFDMSRKKETRFPIFVAGTYIWIPSPESPDFSMTVDGTSVSRNTPIVLHPGNHTARAKRPGRGTLVLKVKDSPAPRRDTFFSQGQRHGILGFN